MIIAVPSIGDDLTSMVCHRLGLCRFILIFDSLTKEYYSVPNHGYLVDDGAGIKTANTIINTGAEIVLSLGVGVKAYSVLTKNNVKVILLKSVCSVISAMVEYAEQKSGEQIVYTDKNLFYKRSGKT